ncbi:hypothetical protein TELCIR_02570 [Teladorsagia circumcincta]|uniref:Peptidase M12A domain-containing protein n=1 Tax=Teladorsagia circumcincta TaxID=45464 RepID=A0A2G9UZ29_TELCI|nr:hypothetical protein TELCIR_02570 [Teladorsagia circumcincta]
MRLILLLLVLAVSTQAGLLDLGKVKDFFKGGNFGEKIKTATLSKFKKEIVSKMDNTVEKLKNTIFEINAVKNVGKSLFQSDILLTKKQIEEVMEGVDGSRAKRQAFKDQNYPQTTWQQGVFYRFDDSADYYTKKIFEMGAKQWEEATCIDFKEDKEKKG